MYATIELAKQAVEDTTKLLWARQHRDHAYVYALSGEYGVLYHPEDRYYSSYLPNGAKVLWHAEFKGCPEISCVWEQRGNHSQGDFDVLRDALGGSAASALLEMFDDDQE